MAGALVHLHLGLSIWPELSHTAVGVARMSVPRGSQGEVVLSFKSWA